MISRSPAIEVALGQQEWSQIKSARHRCTCKKRCWYVLASNIHFQLTCTVWRQRPGTIAMVWRSPFNDRIIWVSQTYRERKRLFGEVAWLHGWFPSQWLYSSGHSTDLSSKHLKGNSFPYNNRETSAWSSELKAWLWTWSHCCFKRRHCF